MHYAESGDTRFSEVPDAGVVARLMRSHATARKVGEVAHPRAAVKLLTPQSAAG